MLSHNDVTVMLAKLDTITKGLQLIAEIDSDATLSALTNDGHLAGIADHLANNYVGQLTDQLESIVIA